MTDISVIIPLTSDETEHKALLTSLPDDMEIILSQESTRATSLNTGAKKAAKEYLWFLHADSRLSEHTISTLYTAIENQPDSLLFFDLAFQDAPLAMYLNSWGAWLRSHLLKVPFGDQGFCMKKDLFQKLGGFPENLPYGEDHVFIWKARQHGIAVQPVCATLYTSARKYKKHGWLKTTLLHQYLWVKQAWPEWKKLKKGQTA